MHPNPHYPPHSYPNIATTLSSNTQSLQAEMPNAMARLKNFHVEIRNEELREYKRKIREEVLRSQQVDELIELVPADRSSACQWAQQLAETYAKTYKYSLPPHKAVEIFKLAEKFPSRQTLELLEVIVLRA
jgi:hypothetical protein